MSNRSTAMAKLLMIESATEFARSKTKSKENQIREKLDMREAQTEERKDLFSRWIADSTPDLHRVKGPIRELMMMAYDLGKKHAKEEV